MMEPENILSCTGIWKTFDQRLIPSSMLQDRILRWRTYRKKWSCTVLKDVSLSLKKGEWIGIYAPNGSGKTTLLRILAGILPPDKGVVHRSGTISCFFDLSAGFHPERSAPENIYLHGILHGRSRTDIRESIDAVIDFAGTASHRDLPMKCYSTGMNLRVAFAASAMIDADVYLFDEVLAVGDAAFQEKCKNHLSQLRQKGKSAIIVSHEINDLELLCDRIVSITQGVLGEDQVSIE